MNRWRRPICAWALGAVLIGGCSSSATSVRMRPSLTPEGIVETIEAQHRAIMFMEGSGSISLQSPEISQSGSFELVLKKPDSLLLKLEGPFGIDVGSALFSRHEFQFYDVLQNRLIVGDMNPANLRRIFRMAVGFDDLIALVAGGTFLGSEDPAAASFSRMDDSYVLTFAGEPYSHQYVIDSVSLQITDIATVRPDGTVVTEQRFGDFRLVDGQLVPFELRVIQRAERRMVSVRYSEITLNAPTIALQFTVPANVRRIRLQ